MALKWSRKEEIIALFMYCQIPFGKIHSKNSDVIKIANILQRTPASISMKMCNFARFDPTLKARGISGLSNGSKLDEEIWIEFNNDWEKLVFEATSALNEYNSSSDDVSVSDEYNIPVGADVQYIQKARRNQDFFRKAVLSSYQYRCCITGLSVPSLLIASHIKPWKFSNPVTERTNPQNGLCLNALHDKAFDKGLITIDTNYRLILSKELKATYDSSIVEEFFFRFENIKICLPERFSPSKEFLEYHNNNVFCC
ncbi:HNH endonuclease [Ruminococcaceae bacterium OttesenSCG-928-A11]|nr:HNH endonuclease [Ruminococcaceae bacterium OttesenSCG-928-A11]